MIGSANNYQNEESEQWIGEWMEERGNRDQMVIATKVCWPIDIDEEILKLVYSSQRVSELMQRESNRPPPLVTRPSLCVFHSKLA
jgi:aryl-alcohol dehydrogenase-like predicted oxidoreductase